MHSILFALLAFLGVACSVSAQSLVVAGQVSTYGSSLTNTVGVAVDSSNNAYVANATGSVYKELYNTTTGAYTESLLFTTGNNQASGIAVDPTGSTVYVGTGTGLSVAKYTGSGTSYSLATSLTGFTGNTLPAVDKSGNLYVADTGAERVYKETLTGGAYSPVVIGNGFSLISGLSTLGTNVYVSDYGANTIYELVGSGTSYSKSSLTTTGITGPQGIAVDSAGTLYVETPSEVYRATLSSGTSYTTSVFYGYVGSALAIDNANTLYLGQATSGAGTKLVPYANLGYINFGSVSPANTPVIQVAFTAISSTTLATASVVTQGITGYDFKSASAGTTCSNATLATGASCQVAVSFSPLASGSREGAISLPAAGGSVAGTAFLGGTGSVPLAVFSSTLTPKTITTSLRLGRGLTVSASGDVYLADSPAGAVYKYPAGAGPAVTVATTPSDCSPGSTAIDGLGNLFIGCNHSNYIYEIYAGTSALVGLNVGFGPDDHMSTDAAGNIYTSIYSDGFGNEGTLVKVAAGTHAVTTQALITGARFVAALTDANGNTFAPDFNNNVLYEIPAGSTTPIVLYRGSPLNQPHAIAEDPAGNLYVSNYTGTTVYRFAAGQYSATPTQLTIIGTDSLAFDSSGIAYSIASDSTLLSFSRSSISLAYPKQAVGTTSSTQTVTLENDGTAPLTFSVPAAGTNPALSANFALSSSSTCPQLSNSSVPATLAAGSTCTDVIAFVPTMVGAFSGSLMHSDNSLNMSSVQTISLTGTGVQGVVGVSVASGSIKVGSTPTITAVISAPNSTDATPAGVVTLTIGTGPAVTATCTAGTGKETCTASYPAAATFTAGNYSITATFAADTNYLTATGTGTLTVTQYPGTSSITATGSGSYGAAITPVTVKIPYVATAAPTGSITLTDTHGDTLTFAASTCTAASGTLTCQVNFPTASEALGTNSVTVTQAADNVYTAASGTGTLTMAQGISPLANTAVQSITISQGTSPTLLTSVGSYGGASAPTGAVSFQIESNGAALATCTGSAAEQICTASYQTGTLALGVYPITLSQAADTNYAAGTASGYLTVISGNTISPILNSASTVRNQAITVGTATATLTASVLYTGNKPTGAVSFQVRNGSMVTAMCTGTGSPLTCTASYPTSSLAAGRYAITATEAADATYPQGSASAWLTVSSADTSTDAPAAQASSSVSDLAIPYGTSTSVLTATLTYGGNIGNAPLGAVTLQVVGGSGGIVTANCPVTTSPITCTASYPTGSLPVGGYAILLTETAGATNGGGTSYPASYSTGTLTVYQAPGTAGITVSGSGTYGAATTPVTVTLAYNGSTAPTGAITLTDANGNTVTIAASTCTVSASRLSCTANLPTANVPAGNDAVTVSQAADSNYATSTGSGTLVLAVAPATSNDTASGSGVYNTPASPVTVTIPYIGAVPPSGLITLQDSNGNTVTVPASTCVAAAGVLTCNTALPTANVPAGTDPVTVSQAADNNYARSTGVGLVTIAQAPPTTNDTAAGTGTYGAPTTPVTVTIPYAGTIPPTGAITVGDGNGNTVTISASSCTANAGKLTCPATLPSANDAVGSVPVTITQAGDANYSTSTGTGALTITAAAAAPISGASATGSAVQNVTISQGTTAATLTTTIAYQGVAAPTGTVSFQIGTGSPVSATCTQDSTLLLCTATYPTASFALGVYPVVATQAADANYPAGTATATLTVTNGTVAPILNTGSTVQDVTIVQGTATANLTSSILYTGAAPAGPFSVSVANGSSVIANCTTAPLALACNASYPTASLAPGTYTITVTGAADANYPQGSATARLTVLASSTTGIDPLLNTGSNVQNIAFPYGTPTATLSASIAYTGTAPTGVVTFQVPGGSGGSVTSACTGTVSPLVCTASYPTASLTLGSYTIVATQAADANYPAGSATGTLTITQVPATSADSVTGSAATGSATIPITVTIPYSGTTAPSGAVTVTDANGHTVAIPASSCTAAAGVLTCTGQFPSATLQAGTDPVSVSQAADANYAQSTGSGTLTIGKVPATSADTVSGSGSYGALTTPVVVLIPYSGATAPTGAITVKDANGNTAVVSASTCIAAAGTLTCTVTLPTANDPVGATTLTITQAGDSNYVGSTGTGTLTLAPAKSTGTDAVSGSGNYGSATTPATVTIPYAGSQPPTGLITVAAGVASTITVPASTCTATAGALTCMVNLPTASLPLGSNPVTVSQAPDANYNGSTGSGVITIAKAIPAGGVTVSGTGTYGTPSTAVTITIPFTGTQSPTGSITVSDTHGNLVTVPASSCTASAGVLTCAVTFPSANLSAGIDTLTVVQAADANYPAVTGTGTLTLAKAAATTGDQASGSVPFGSSTSPVTLTIPYTGATAPTGAITVSDTSGNTLTVAAASCTAAGAALTCQVTFPSGNLLAGSDPLTVTQAADSNYSGSTGTGSLVVTKASVAGVLTAAATSINLGQSTTLTETLTGVKGTTPTGTVSFYNGATLVETGTLNSAGVVTVPVTALPAGTTTLTAVYNGDSNYLPVTSNVVTIVVSVASTATSLTSSANPQIVGQPVTFTATTTSTSAAITGTVSFFNGTQRLGTSVLNASGMASLTTTTLPAGVLSITASYSGDALHLASTSTPLPQSVTDFTIASSTPTITVDPGQLANFSINLASFTGTVFSNSVVLSATGLPSNFTSSFSPASVVPGTAGANSNLAVQTFANLVARERSSPAALSGAVLSALLLPFFGIGRLRRKLPKAALMLLLLVSGLGVTLSMTGCAGGIFGPQPGSYTITVTGTSGTLQHSTTVTLNVR